MSDLLIRNMQMPETCKLCYLSEFDPGFYAFVCKPTGIRIDYDMAKIDRPRTICPLLPVPPHGRLIDADALLFNIPAPIEDEYKYVRRIIEDAPTIIEAEEGET